MPCAGSCLSIRALPDHIAVIYSHICRRIKPPTGRPRPTQKLLVRPSTLFSYRPRQFPARIGLNFEPAAFVIASISAATAAAAAAATSDARRSKCINSGQSTLTRDRIADTHKSFTGIRQVAPLCTPHLIHSFISPQNGSKKQNGNRT